MASRFGRVALSGICAGIAIYVAVHSEDDHIRATAALTSSCLVGFTATSLVLEQHRQRKSREVNTDAYVELLRQINAQRPILPQQPNACQGCQHYHGRMYGGNFFVCGMHPYGMEADHCPDWEGKTEQPPSDLDF